MKKSVLVLVLITFFLVSCTPTTPVTPPSVTPNPEKIDSLPIQKCNEKYPCSDNKICLREVCLDRNKAFLYSNSDLPFVVDCSQLTPSQQSKCSSFLNYTRDVNYPLLREITGTNLSSCYKQITYQFISGNRGHGVASKSGNIQFSEDFLSTGGDVHELFHVINYCNGALDLHLFHEAAQEQIFLRIHVPKASSDSKLSSIRGSLDAARSAFAKNPQNSYYNRFVKSGECAHLLVSLVSLYYHENNFNQTMGLYQELAEIKDSKVLSNSPLKPAVDLDPPLENDFGRIILLTNILRTALTESGETKEAFSLLETYCGLSE